MNALNSYRTVVKAALASVLQSGFDSVSRERAAAQLETNLWLSSEFFSDSACRLYMETAVELLRSDNVDVPKLLGKANQLALTATSMNMVLLSLNQDIAWSTNREITSHGLFKSFRFWSIEERKKYLESANDLLNVIKERFPLVVFGYGIALGFQRSGDLIPHDDDVDILVVVEAEAYASLTEALAELSAHLASRGYFLYGKWPGHRKAARSREIKDVDVFVGIKEGDFLSFIPGPRKKIKYSDVFPAVVRTVSETPIPLPSNIEGYLGAVYGIDWREPQPGWQHNWSLAEYTDVLSPTLPDFPFQADRLMSRGYQWVVLDENNSILSLHTDKPDHTGAVELRKLRDEEVEVGLIRP
ncbi:hypothetical protein IMZ29_03855 [Achromobacter sp. GG226]|uniref:hypothetical protein n=1 Tax=Verticiella alkaliphila TaxID=2779529 RepID=UPI001C0BD3AE|nr:hypothetical protein [Verticiella sp. GG226]MBU4609714.1 hypothetical protein [Verticiella sp. GG226]